MGGWGGGGEVRGGGGGGEVQCVKMTGALHDHAENLVKSNNIFQVFFTEMLLSSF